MVLWVLRVFEADAVIPVYARKLHGRTPFDLLPMMRAFVAKALIRIATTEDLIRRLRADPNLRRICGFRKVPSRATFSRALRLLAADDFLDRAASVID
jgi:transposase